MEWIKRYLHWFLIFLLLISTATAVYYTDINDGDPQTQSVVNDYYGMNLTARNNEELVTAGVNPLCNGNRCLLIAMNGAILKNVSLIDNICTFNYDLFSNQEYMILAGVDTYNFNRTYRAYPGYPDTDDGVIWLNGANRNGDTYVISVVHGYAYCIMNVTTLYTQPIPSFLDPTPINNSYNGSKDLPIQIKTNCSDNENGTIIFLDKNINPKTIVSGNPGIEAIYNLNSTVVNLTGENTYYYKGSCLSGDTLYNTSTRILNYDGKAPKINLIFPVNETHYNEYLAVNFTTDENSSCSINESVYFDTYFYNGTYFQYNETSLPNGDYSILINCNDSLNNEEYYSLAFTKDMTLPVITYTVPAITNDTVFYYNQTKSLYIKCTDNNLYAYEVLVYNELGILKYNFSLDGISASSVTITDSIQPASLGTWQIDTTCSDSHTLNLLNTLNIESEDKKLKFNFEEIKDFKKKENNISIELISNQAIDSLTTTKLKDRYTFNYLVDSKDLLQKNHFKFKVECKGITPIKDSKYNGHLICKDSSMWVDFENEYLIKGTTDIYSCGNDCYIVEFDVLKSKDSNYIFKSIGGLNFNTLSAKFIVSVASTSTSSSISLDLTTVEDLMLLFILIFLYLALIVIGFYFKNNVFVSFAFFIGVFIGVLIFTFSHFLTLILFLMNITMYLVYAKQKN